MFRRSLFYHVFPLNPIEIPWNFPRSRACVATHCTRITRVASSWQGVAKASSTWRIRRQKWWKHGLVGGIPSPIVTIVIECYRCI